MPTQTATITTTPEAKAANPGRKVRFGSIHIREYAMTLGDNPCVSIGPPVMMSWEYTAKEETSQPIEDFEKTRVGKRRHKHRLLLNYYQRHEILESAGVTKKEIQTAERGIFYDQSSRKFSSYYCYVYTFVGAVKASSGRRKNKRWLRKYKRDEKKQQNQQGNKTLVPLWIARKQ
jgi:hypothetical protein